VGIAIGSAIKPAHMVSRASALVTNMVASRYGTGSLADFFRCHNFSKKVGSVQWLQSAFC
jgi:hypothetical protein